MVWPLASVNGAEAADRDTDEDTDSGIGGLWSRAGPLKITFENRPRQAKNAAPEGGASRRAVSEPDPHAVAPVAATAVFAPAVALVVAPAPVVGMHHDAEGRTVAVVTVPVDVPALAVPVAGHIGRGAAGAGREGAGGHGGGQ